MKAEERASFLDELIKEYGNITLRELIIILQKENAEDEF